MQRRYLPLLIAAFLPSVCMAAEDANADKSLQQDLKTCKAVRAIAAENTKQAENIAKLQPSGNAEKMRDKFETCAASIRRGADAINMLADMLQRASEDLSSVRKSLAEKDKLNRELQKQISLLKKQIPENATSQNSKGISADIGPSALVSRNGIPGIAPSPVQLGSDGRRTFPPQTNSSNPPVGDRPSPQPQGGRGGTSWSSGPIVITSPGGVVYTNDGIPVDFGPYMAYLQRRIKRAWFPPQGHESRKLIIVFKIHSGGELSDLRVERASGVAIADQAGLAAVQSAAPFRPLPAGAPSVVDIQFTFDDNLFQGGQSF